jgi:hypothetical protein
MSSDAPEPPTFDHRDIPPTLASPGAGAFWMAVLLTGVGTGIGAGLFTLLRQSVERLMLWPGPNIVEAAAAIANVASDRARLSDEQRRLLVACGACTARTTEWRYGRGRRGRHEGLGSDVEPSSSIAVDRQLSTRAPNPKW